MSTGFRYASVFAMNAKRSFRVRRVLRVGLLVRVVAFVLFATFLRGSTSLALVPARPLPFTERMAVAEIRDEIRAKRTDIVTELRSLVTDYWEQNRREDTLVALRRLLAIDDTGEKDVLFTALCYATSGEPATATELLLDWALKHAAHAPSVRLRRAISVFAGAAGQSELAEAWWARATAAGSGAASQRWSAASWLSWAGFPDVARLEREAILSLAPESSTATSSLRLKARSALAIDELPEAADAYIQTGRRQADSSGLSRRARMDGAAGYACKAIVLDSNEDDFAARAAVLCAERWAGGDTSALGRLLWVLEKAPPAPWVVALVRRIAQRTERSSVDTTTTEIAHEARRWLGAKLAGDIIIRPARMPDHETLTALLAGVADIAWVVQDTTAPNLRWIGTKDQFVFLDDARKWELLRWPEILMDMDRPALAAHSAAFNAEAVWIGTDCGLLRYDRRGGEWTQEIIADELIDAGVDVVVMGNETLTVRVVRDGATERWRYWWDYDSWQRD